MLINFKREPSFFAEKDIKLTKPTVIGARMGKSPIPSGSLKRSRTWRCTKEGFTRFVDRRKKMLFYPEALKG